VIIKQDEIGLENYIKSCIVILNKAHY